METIRGEMHFIRLIFEGQLGCNTSLPPFSPLPFLSAINPHVVMGVPRSAWHLYEDREK